MKLVAFVAGSHQGVGLEDDRGIHDLGYETLQALIADHPDGVIACEPGDVVVDPVVVAPLRPGKILCCGTNYRSHLDENPAAVLPDEPFFFSKLPSAVIGPGDAIVIPLPGVTTDYEVELAMVIGKRSKSLLESNALDAVFGWTILNDVSARSIQFKDNQITLGKGVDTFAPLGPRVVTRDEFGDPSAMKLWTTVNGEQRQSSDAGDMLFTPARILSELTAFITLEPGDLVTTGTPAGVAAFMYEPGWLQPGDVVTVAVEGIGELTNPVVSGWESRRESTTGRARS